MKFSQDLWRGSAEAHSIDMGAATLRYFDTPCRGSRTPVRRLRLMMKM
jgi:hypothetical protein